MGLAEGVSIMPEVSIIVPAFNPPSEYLAEMIQSVLNQSFENFEMLIIDDGSDNKHREIIDDAASVDSRISVIHMSRRGVSAARNTGLSRARGRYLTFLDSDDHVCPGFLASAVEAIGKHGADVAIGWVRHVDDGHVDCDPPFLGESDVVFTGDDLDLLRSFALAAMPPKALAKYRNLSISTVAAKVFTRCVVEGLKVDEQLAYSEDSLFNVMMLQRASKVVIVHKPWYEYVNRPDSSTNRPAIEMLDKVSDVAHYQQIVKAGGFDSRDIALHTAKFLLQLFSPAARELRLMELAEAFRERVPIELKKAVKESSTSGYSVSLPRRVAIGAFKSGSPLLVALTLKLNILIRG